MVVRPRMKGTRMTVIDVIIPVYNSLEYTHMCLRSVFKYAVNNDAIRTNILIIDDASDEYVARYLDGQAAYYPCCKVIHNEQNLGFVKTCNEGMRQSEGDIVILLNSDTIVTQDFIEKIIGCFKSDPRIGIASPTTNSSPNMYIRVLPGYTIFSMAELVGRLSEKRYPDIVTPEGFCFCISRAIIEKQGFFDEIYDIGYCEESDYAMRALKNGFRTVCIDDLYIFHQRHATFKKSHRNRRYQKNRSIFNDRWLSFYRQMYRRNMCPNPIAYLRKKVSDYQIPEGNYYENREATTLTHRLWTIEYSLFEYGIMTTLRLTVKILIRPIRTLLITPVRLFGRFVQTYLEEGPGTAFTKTLMTCYRFVQPVLTMPHRVNQRVFRKHLNRFSEDRKQRFPRAVFVLPDIRMSGGVISVINLVNELLLSGVDVSVVVSAANKGRADSKYLFEPIYFRRISEAVKYLPRADIYIATLWTTAFYVDKLVKENRAVTAYFIQDYEVNFVRSRRFKSRVRDTYKLIPNKFAKTQWLVDRMREEGWSCFKINPGMDLHIFYPNPISGGEKVTILAMNRNGTSRRGSETLLKSLKIVKRRCPDTHIRLFRDKAADTGFEYEFLGPLSHKELAEYYRQSDIYVDASSVHGFGRPGAEAMASGCALVSTDSGGVREYAVDGQNCLLTRVGDAEDVARQVVTLVRNKQLRERLQQAGIETVQAYAEPIAAAQFWEWAESLIEANRQAQKEAAYDN